MTSRNPLCGAVADHIVDPRGEAPEGLEAHLASCPECRSLARAHQTALAVGEVVRQETTAAAAPVLGRAAGANRRTRFTLRVVLSGATLAAAAAIFLVARPVPRPREESAVASRSVDAGAHLGARGTTVFDLMDEADGYARSDRARAGWGSASYAGFGGWFGTAGSERLDAPLSRGDVFTWAEAKEETR